MISCRVLLTGENVSSGLISFFLTDADLQLANLFNNYFSQIGSELRKQISINVRDPSSFFDEADKNYSAFRFYESTPDEVGMVNSKFSLRLRKFFLSPPMVSEVMYF